MMVIIAFIFAMLVESSPVFFIISLIYSVFLVIISRIVGSIWSRMILDQNIAAEAATLPIMSYMMPRLHIISFVAAMSILVIMIAKRGGQG
jgi:hypothetical protein